MLFVFFAFFFTSVRSVAALTNILRVGATRQGKTLAAARSIVESPGVAMVVLDPHKQSLAEQLLIHASGNILYERLSDIKDTLRFDLLPASKNPNDLIRLVENQRRAEAFVDILLRRRNTDGLAGTPLLEEWIMAAIMLFLCQSIPKPIEFLPFAFLPGTDNFRAMVRNCPADEIRHKFEQLTAYNPRALRAEVGSAARLINGVFRSPAFVLRAGRGFDFGAFLQNRGLLIVERGDEIGDDTMRAIMGAIVLKTIEHAKQRPSPYPPIRIVIDEATNARLVGGPELRGIAETNKNGLYWEFLVQNLDFPGGSDAVLQNCIRHEWYGCPHYDLARKAATDVVAGLPADERTRAERIAALTDEIMGLAPGWRDVREKNRSWREYVPLLENPWPDWPGLREEKLREKLQWIHGRPEYRIGGDDGSPSMPSSHSSPPRPDNSPNVFSPAQKWKRGERKPTVGSSDNTDAGGSD